MADVGPAPAHVSFQLPAVRWAILGAYWLVILLALPLWWSTTSIERLSLPSAHVRALSPEKLHFPIRVQVDASSAGAHSPWLAEKVQDLVNERLKAPRYGRHGLDVYITADQEPDDSYMVKIDPQAQTNTIDDRTLTCTQDSFTPSKLANTLISLLTPFQTVSSKEVRSHRAAKYAPRYRLAFSLLNEDATQGQAAIGWDINASLAQNLYPTLNSLNVLHNFTLESQVQFHAPLAFTPRAIETGLETVYGLTAEDLTLFVNSAEWTLSSSASNDPVLHFILFVPSASRRPLQILDASGSPTRSSAFILPQWGGIMIYNPPPEVSSHFHMTSAHLEPILSTFKHQLLALLGVPELPSEVSSSGAATPLSTWQLDALLRHRALENVQDSADTLQSIINLVDQIKNMPVKEDVRADVQDALKAIDMTYEAAPESAALALLHSSRALTLSSCAFFNPGMLALLYFPPEHTYAVYAPLFAPISLPLIAPLVTAWWKKWKDARKKRAEQKSVRKKRE